MFCCVRQVRIPFIQPYLPLKCMSLRTQSFPKFHQGCEEIPHVQCESFGPPSASESLQNDFLWDESLSYNVIPTGKVTEFVEDSRRVPAVYLSSIAHRTRCQKKSHTTINIASDPSKFSIRSADYVRHNLVVFPECSGNFQSAVNFTMQHERLSPKLHTVSTAKSGVLRYSSEKKSTQESSSSGRATEEQLLKIQEGLIQCLPKFFMTPHNYSLYNANLVFHNNISGVTTRGILAYTKHLSMVRILGMLKYSSVIMHVLKVTNHPEDGTVRVRWRISGVPGMKALLMFWKFRPSTIKDLKEAEWTDGFSVFHVGSDGVIYKHVCDKIMPDDNVEKVGPGTLGVKFAAGLGLLSNGGYLPL